MYLKYVILLITVVPVFSQSFFKLDLDPVLINLETANDIRTFDLSKAEFYVYNKIPDLSYLSTQERKIKFINLILPAILIEKQKIKMAYNYVVNNFDNLYLNESTKELYDYCKCKTVSDLLLCLTEQPTSIIIAQAAIESGWGTSRFFLEGFNLFGIHTYDNTNQNMKAHNSSRVYVKKYNSISESISHYLRTLARVDAYSEFRNQRANSKDVKYIINYLINYSERRKLYVDDLESIIEYNKLYRYDSLIINN